jgi:hypothetical protein
MGPSPLADLERTKETAMKKTVKKLTLPGRHCAT